ncbi:DNA-binding protein SMUBP-2 [Biomphalaria pfeifferi]|uniref:DNA helicase n=1 Tax=Biomphalaria pfeifferi TaxID=112525 RepID=A0AAD8F614_BIOPF|nr:DNA-binding protein SMUBP-2 [Biomphalaria pfeifferi]
MSDPEDTTVSQFVIKTLDLVEKEKDEALARDAIEHLSIDELVYIGKCIVNLKISEYQSGFFGRTTMVLTFTNASDEPLPFHKIAPGSIVGLTLTQSPHSDNSLSEGLVSFVNPWKIEVVFDEYRDVIELSDAHIYKLTKLSNDVTYRRLKKALEDLLEKSKSGPWQRLINTLFGIEDISIPGKYDSFKFGNKKLDDYQKEAVKFALNQKEIAIIHGPPGTGKTTTVVDLIIQAVRQGLKVLVTAPSNVAVDNITERLGKYQVIDIIRIGHPARFLPHVRKHSLDFRIEEYLETIKTSIRSDINNCLNRLKNCTNLTERRNLTINLNLLIRRSKEKEAAAAEYLMPNADVVLATLTSASRDGKGPMNCLADDHFDLVVIDECSQAIEAACWIGILQGKRCVLAGDHLQLPPTILSREAAAEGLKITLMERLMKTVFKWKHNEVVRMLHIQYRMHQDIMAWSSETLYAGQLEAHHSVATHLLKDLEHIAVEYVEETNFPLLLIDTAGCDVPELNNPEEVSKANEGEVEIVVNRVEELIGYGVKPSDIAVISPYNFQVKLIRLQLCSRYFDLEVKTVDGFQGREKEVVIISMVRSNLKSSVGFLAEIRRINVAVTRARRHLTVICDTATVCTDKFIKSMVDHLHKKGKIRSGNQYLVER